MICINIQFSWNVVIFDIVFSTELLMIRKQLVRNTNDRIKALNNYAESMETFSPLAPGTEQFFHLFTLMQTEKIV